MANGRTQDDVLAPPDIDSWMVRRPPPTRDPILARTNPPPTTPPLSGITPVSTPAPAQPPPLSIPRPFTPAPWSPRYANIPTPEAAPVVPTPNYVVDPSGRNNPGNIKIPGTNQFQRFPTPQAGFDAIGQTLIGYQDQHGLNTVAGIISRYSPPTENNTERLIANAAARMGVDPNQPIDMHDPATRRKMVNAIVAQEQQGGASSLPQQQYIPASQTPGLNNRPPNQWGRTPEGGYDRGPPGSMPALFDIPRVMAQGLALLPLLSLFTKGGVIPMMAGFGAYVQGYQQGQLLKQKLAQGQWRENLDETVAKMERESIDYGDAFATYANNEEALNAELTRIASGYGDDAMSAAVQQGGSKSAYALMQRRDPWFTDLNKLKYQQQQAEDRHQSQLLYQEIQGLRLQQMHEMDPLRKQELEERIKLIQEQIKQKAATTENPLLAPGETKPGDVAPDATTAAPAPTEQPDTTTPPPEPPPEQPDTGTDTGGATGGATGTTPGDQGAATQAPAAPTRTAAEPPPQPAQRPYQEASLQPTPPPLPPAPSVGAPPAQAAPPPPQPSEPGSAMGPAMRRLNEYGRGLARQHLQGDRTLTSGPMAKFAVPAILGAQEMQNQLNAIPHELQGRDAVMNAVRAIDPGMANTLDLLLRTKLPLGGRYGVTSTNQAFWSRMADLAVQADAGWSPQQYPSLQLTRNAYAPQGPMGKTLLRAERLRQTAESLWEDAKSMPAGPIPVNILQQWLQTGVAADPKYTKYATDWHNFAVDIQAVNTGGAPTVTLTSMLLDTLHRGATPAMIRTAIQADLNSAFGSIDSAMNGYRQSFPEERNPATFDQRTYSSLWQLWHGNRDTGVLGEAPPTIGTYSPGEGYYIGGDPSDTRNYRERQ